MDTKLSGAPFAADYGKQEQPKKAPWTKLEQFSSEELLGELARRGGPLKACAEAQLLCLRKSQDYNNTGGNAGTFNASRDDYFPFGLASYAQMIHTKSQRLISLAKKDSDATASFESARDTALDLINYASFLADWLDRMDGVKA